MIATLYPTFRRWSDGRGVWIISDTHFGDHDCKLMDPDWPDINDQIKTINHSIKEPACLIHLGDVGDPYYIKRLKGKYKILLTGNHDAGVSKYEEYFDEIYNGPLMISDKIILSHEPVDVPWAFNIHGHDHASNNIGDDHHYNVTANVHHYIAANLNDIIKSGVLKNIMSLHGSTIERARERNDYFKENIQ